MLSAIFYSICKNEILLGSVEIETSQLKVARITAYITSLITLGFSWFGFVLITFILWHCIKLLEIKLTLPEYFFVLGKFMIFQVLSVVFKTATLLILLKDEIKNILINESLNENIKTTDWYLINIFATYITLFLGILMIYISLMEYKISQSKALKVSFVALFLFVLGNLLEN